MEQKSELNQIEEYFQWWLDELISYGFIKSYKREPETIQVLSTAEYGRIKRFKTKENEIEKFNLFPAIRYTYDYIIVWAKKAEYIFYEEINDLEVFQFGRPALIASQKEIDGNIEVISYVDVKPTTSVMQVGGKVSTAISFPLKQRMIWDHHKLFINKIVPIPMAGTGYKSALFINTFTPQRYHLTDGGKQLRKVKWKFVNLNKYVANKSQEIETLLNIKN